MVTRSSIPVQIRCSRSTSAWSGAMRPAASAALWLRKSMRLQRSLPRRAGCGSNTNTGQWLDIHLQRSLPRRAGCGHAAAARAGSTEPFNNACPEGQDAASPAGCETTPGGSFNEACPEGQDAARHAGKSRQAACPSTKPAPKGRMRRTTNATIANMTHLQRSLPRRAGCGERLGHRCELLLLPSTKPAPKGRMRPWPQTRRRSSRGPFNEACPEGQDAAWQRFRCGADQPPSTKPAPKGRMRRELIAEQV